MRRIHRDIVGTFILSNDGFIVLGKSRQGGVYKDFWVVPGGGIESGETKPAAAIRETLEEVGIDISSFKMFLLDKVLTGQSQKTLRDTGEKVVVDMTFYNFLVHADRPANQIIINCADDLVEAKWHPVNELRTLNVSPPTRETLQSLGYV